MNTNLALAAMQQAINQRQPLVIEGGLTKAFYGHNSTGLKLSTSALAGIVRYEPDELLLSVGAGTPLVEIEHLLQQHQQRWPFEPPIHNERATVGGMVACGFSGPARLRDGAVRDAVLGVDVIDGRARQLHFGGDVMKNVAGFDVSRLMVGAMGTLGLITRVSFRLLPQPRAVASLKLACGELEAIALSQQLLGLPLPISATAFENDHLSLRLSGSASAVKSASAQLRQRGFKPSDDHYWTELRHQRHPFFSQSTLWRLSIKATTAPLQLGPSLHEWGSALRWVVSSDAAAVRAAAAAAGGHATLYRGELAGVSKFEPQTSALERIHQGIKQVFDPEHLINRNRWLFHQAS